MNPRGKKSPFRKTGSKSTGPKNDQREKKDHKPFEKFAKKSSGPGKKPFKKKTGEDKSDKDKKPFRKPGSRPFNKKAGEDRFAGNLDFKGKKPFRKPGSKPPFKKKFTDENSETSAPRDGSMRLNKYLSNAGICSRREADQYILTGAVSVNGQVVTELGHKINPGDKVAFGGKTVKNEKPVYLLINKPKDYITTTKDPNNRKTVMEIVKDACKERVFPVGRLDRNTTGLLLLTNDGALADKLMHPRKGVVKIYHVELDKNFTKAHLEELSAGVTLEDGFFQPDEVSFTETGGRKEVGIRIHSGKNHIVRRLFQHLGYSVVKLDRVYYAGLTKKNLPRGKWRFLSQQEVNMLHMA